MKQLLQFAKRLLLFAIPFYIIVGIYMFFDPFKVVWNYDNYYPEDDFTGVTLDKDYVSTQNFDNYYPQQRYNSFILGNSRSIFYEIEEWQKHLPPYASCYHFDASGESLTGVCGKIAYLDKQGVAIENLLLVFDAELLGRIEPIPGHLFTPAPQWSTNNWLNFHAEFIHAFLDSQFFTSYFCYRFTGEKPASLPKGEVLSFIPFSYNPITNEERQTTLEEEIRKGTYYTPQRVKAFYERPVEPLYSMPMIKEQQYKLLEQTAKILKRQQTNYEIVLSPSYNQEMLSPADLAALHTLFGEAHVHNFAGINELTTPYTNYYEPFHYRPHVAKEIMRKIY